MNRLMDNRMSALDIKAYKMYEHHMIHNLRVDQYIADWWFYEHKEDFPEYYKLAEVALRKKKINKILEKING